MNEVVAALVAPVGEIVGCPSGHIEMRQVKIGESLLSIAPQSPATSGNMRKPQWVSFKYSHQTLEQPRIGIIVRFCDPDVFASRQLHALVPLLERAAGVHFIKFQPYARIA